ncbi:hypothetical protein [Brucella pituitosa]|uniref:hypothetical protein n=1 Tax=Brucella pituitosa TaxID=571256 RepID=UPI003F4AAC27|nr:hypothetical protein [Ochrobactrum sp. A-1]
MVQAAFFDRVSFDPFAFEQDGLSASKVDVGGSEIVVAYKARDDREREAILDQLVGEAQEQDMDY